MKRTFQKRFILTAIILSLLITNHSFAQLNLPFKKSISTVNILGLKNSKDKSAKKSEIETLNSLSIRTFFKQKNTRTTFINDFYKKIYSKDQNESNLLNNVSSQLFGKNTYVGAEFLSFYSTVFPTRFAVGGSFKATGDTAKDNKLKTNLQNILQNGGNLYFNFDMPLLFESSSDDNFHFGISWFNNWSFNSSTNFAADTSTMGITWQSGFNIHTDFNFISTDSKGSPALASIDLNTSYFTGSNSLLQKLGTTDFGLLQLKFSVVVANNLSFFAQYPIISSSSYVNDNLRQITGGIAFSPSQMLSSAN